MSDVQLMLAARKRLVAVVTGCGAVAILAAYALRLPAQQADADFRPVRVVGAQKPITEFPSKRVRELRDQLNPSELVLGVTIGKESRAYPINMLTGPSREILNDTLGGQPIAATW
ncbi:MAG: DUF3179 domain-containing protein [Planctomycetes bacterium]|nr:DUF3179 domain-containing protein [Planctomycetota bacterium]